MLLLPLDQFPRVQALHRLFPVAVDWCRRIDPALASGRHDLSGDDLFAIIEDGPTVDAGVRRLEAHRRYLDIQLVLAGGEIMEWAPLAGLVIDEDLPARDLTFFRDPATPPARVAVRPGQAAVFFPEDAHRPGLHLGAAAARCRKVVVKVRLGAG
jgi:YhcH/YjgK/YiaL family protein